MKIAKFSIFLFFIVFILFSSCVDENLNENNNEVLPDYGDAYSLQFTVTLDNMSSRSFEPNELRKWENYVDLNKFRVLFFDSQDRFLFESKNRWVKKENDLEGANNNIWLVSVPLFSHGDDTEEYDWDWEEIRKVLTNENFKIALLVNVPHRMWNMGVYVRKEVETSPGKFEWQNDLSQPPVVATDWIDNNGPHWTKKDTRFVDEENCKKIFDLHHAQYDPVYDAKNYYTDTGKPSADNDGYYDPFTDFNEEGKPMMGAVESWVDYGENDTNNPIRDEKGWEFRNVIHPSADHPIPMYGIQEYAAINSSVWEPGTTFTLGRKDQEGLERIDKSISLLRSVVKLELLIPKNQIGTLDFVTLWYSNIYGRVEPMDCWTPTDELWEKTGHTGDDKKDDRHICTEMQNIIDYGPVCRNGDPDAGSTPAQTQANRIPSKEKYQERLSWFFGKWDEKGWPFKGLKTNKKDDNSPSIFNTCIQRNNTVFVPKNLYENMNDIPGYYHIVVYTGERNINDPSNLGRIGGNGSGNPTLIYWMFGNGTSVYSVPIINFSDPSFQNAKSFICRKTDQGGKPDNNTNGLGGYLRAVFGYGSSDNNNNTTVPKPFPLIRNHVYRLTIGIDRAPGTRGEDDLSVSYEVSHSPSIYFPEATERLRKNNEINKTSATLKAN